MKNIRKITWFFPLVLALFIISLAVYYLFPGKTLAPVLKSQVATKLGNTSNSIPELTVLNFYDGYIKFKGNPLSGGAYTNSPYLSDGFKKILENKASSFKTGDLDPVLCFVGKPDTLDIHQATVSGNITYVTITETFLPNRKVDNKVELDLTNGSYLITNIKCGLVYYSK